MPYKDINKRRKYDRISRKKYRVKHPGHNVRQYLTAKEYSKALRLYPKDGRCQLCKRVSKKKRLALDHCHKTNRFRGWICMTCNTSLAGFGDSIKGLKLAISYLEKAR